MGEKTEMMAMSGLSYHIMITDLEDNTKKQGIDVFARLLLIDTPVAEQILGSYPIVFLSDVNRDEYKRLKPKLLEISKSGVEFTVTTKAPVSTPHVTWLSRPNYMEAGGKLIRYVEFQWRGNAFVCPNCNETFLFQRMGNPLARFVKTQEKPAEGAVSEVSVADVVPDQAESVEPVAEEVMELNEPELVVEETPVAGEEVNIEPMEPAEEDTAEVVELTPLSISELPAEELPEAEDILTEVAPVEEVAAPVTKAPAEESNNNLFLSKIVAKDKKESAAKLISEIKGISLEEARKLTERMLIPVLKEVTEAEAKACLDRFKKLGVAGRITKMATR
jgi:ribosomal protein L7/L12